MSPTCRADIVDMLATDTNVCCLGGYSRQTQIPTLSAKALFNLLTTVNESGNQNIVSFTGAMDFETNLPPCFQNIG